MSINTIWDGSSETRPDPSVLREPDAYDYRRIVRELQETQETVIEAIELAYAIAAVDIASGNLITVNGSGEVVLADFRISGVVSGMAIQDVKIGDGVPFIRTGRVHREDWTSIIGNPKLEAGSEYFLDYDGFMTTMPPTTGYVVKVGQAITPELFSLLIFNSVRL
jgi:hypothetical protein